MAFDDFVKKIVKIELKVSGSAGTNTWSCSPTATGDVWTLTYDSDALPTGNIKVADLLVALGANAKGADALDITGLADTSKIEGVKGISLTVNTGVLEVACSDAVYAGFKSVSHLDASYNAADPALLIARADDTDLSSLAGDVEDVVLVVPDFKLEDVDVSTDKVGNFTNITNDALTEINVTDGESDEYKTFLMDFKDSADGAYEDKFAKYDGYVGAANTTLTFTDKTALTIDLNDKEVFNNIHNVKGGSGADTIIGVDGVADTLAGGKGKDVFVFNEDSGADTIADYKKEDTLKFKDYVLDDLTVAASGNNKVVISDSDGNSVTLSTISYEVTTSSNLDDGATTVKIEDMVGKVTNVMLGKKLLYNTANDDYIYDGIANGTLVIDKKSGSADLWLDEEINNGTIKNVGTIDANASYKSQVLHGNDEANVLTGGHAADLLWGGEGSGDGTNVLTGNDGADVFYIGSDEGNVKIADYDTKEKDIIRLYKDDFADAEISLNISDVVLTFDTNSKVTVTGGKDNVLTLENKDGAEQKLLVSDNAMTYAADIDKYVFTGAAGGLTVDSKAGTVDLWLGNDANRAGAEFVNVNDINASASKVANALHGNAKANKLVGGSGNDAIWGGSASGAGVNTLTGGKGADAFYVGGDEGNVEITDYTTADKDTVVFYKNSFTDLAVSATGKNVIIDFNEADGRITLDKAANTAITLTDMNGVSGKMLVASQTGSSLTYANDINAYHGNGDGSLKLIVGADAGAVNIWLDNTYEGKAGADYYNTINNIDASASKADNALHGNDEDNKIIGGSGNDAIWAGKGGNNTVYGGGGADTFYVTADGENTLIKDGTALDTVLLYNCGITDIADVDAVLDGRDLTISVGNSAVTIANWSATGLDTFKVSENLAVSYKFDKETSKLVVKA